MGKIFTVIIIAMLITACNPTRNDYVCNKSDQDKMAEFIIQCAKAANPHSDEEGEDLVRECRRTAQDIYCEWGKVRNRDLGYGARNYGKDQTK